MQRFKVYSWLCNKLVEWYVREVYPGNKYKTLQVSSSSIKRTECLGWIIFEAENHMYNLMRQQEEVFEQEVLIRYLPSAGLVKTEVYSRNDKIIEFMKFFKSYLSKRHLFMVSWEKQSSMHVSPLLDVGMDNEAWKKQLHDELLNTADTLQLFENKRKYTKLDTGVTRVLAEVVSEFDLTSSFCETKLWNIKRDGELTLDTLGNTFHSSSSSIMNFIFNASAQSTYTCVIGCRSAKCNNKRDCYNCRQDGVGPYYASIIPEHGKHVGRQNIQQVSPIPINKEREQEVNASDEVKLINEKMWRELWETRVKIRAGELPPSAMNVETVNFAQKFSCMCVS
ncbi:hypothetical protein M951_chr3173 (nucleomorph) [Lotharella oceanica]|uniref:Uncharacterized protein n=1 Tax=Lotharella oceanica TaxID=641309 RepID=A0A060DGJ1_9EUKA|nr:hypothetical protein M951_chr132 [Lotharella oceanica]AIB09678.1 hypothetical protein M951_chr1199 [Lotharella oceanica]AIB09735.1 hypothetical protein M951_chr232 [Lotharella oceanica]AIB09881.1 hypothetical protein M951_chr2189 [Lotharella oceanica]AIB09938.1 hypothetical protein M951_chr332 [Lotharella oceanica]